MNKDRQISVLGCGRIKEEPVILINGVCLSEYHESSFNTRCYNGVPSVDLGANAMDKPVCFNMSCEMFKKGRSAKGKLIVPAIWVNGKILK